jgi:plasmid maintenance system antidote protein VapI
MKLIDYLKEKYNLKSDSAVAEFLSTSPPEISRFRNGKKALSPRIILEVHDKTNMSIKQIKELANGNKE